MALTWQVIEDNGGGLHLAVMEEGEVTYYSHGYERDEGGLITDLRALRAGASPRAEGWELPEGIDAPQAAYDNLTSYEYGWQIVADQDGTYHDRMGAAARQVFGEGTTWQAWLGESLLGEGPTREAAIEAAVAEYERTGEYSSDERDPHLFASREALIAALAIDKAED